MGSLYPSWEDGSSRNLDRQQQRDRVARAAREGTRPAEVLDPSTLSVCFAGYEAELAELDAFARDLFRSREREKIAGVAANGTPPSEYRDRSSLEWAFQGRASELAELEALAVSRRAANVQAIRQLP